MSGENLMWDFLRFNKHSRVARKEFSRVRALGVPGNKGLETSGEGTKDASAGYAKG